MLGTVAHVFEQFRLPIRRRERQRRGDVDVPAAADHKEFRIRCGSALQSGEKIFQKNDVAIYVAAKIVARQLLRFAEHIVEAHGAEGCFFYVWFVMDAEFAGDFRAAFIVAKEDDLDFGMQQRPAFQRVTLDYGDVAAKGFRRSEYGQHFFQSAFEPVAAGLVVGAPKPRRT